MLTKEVLQSNAGLSTLTDDQFNAIAELSKNDENTVIANKTREIWDSVDADIKTVTGEEKPTGTKSYDHLKATLGSYKTKAGANNSVALQTEIDQLKAEKVELLKSGAGDAALKQQVATLTQSIADKESTIGSLRGDLTTKGAEWQQKVDDEKAKNVDFRFDSTFAEVRSGLKYLPGIPKGAINAVLNTASANTKKVGVSEVQKNDDGSESIVFRDDKGLIITNPNNLQKPMTASEHYLSQLGDIIDGGIKQKGGGGGANQNQKPSHSIGSATDKVQANDAIRASLKERNIQPGSTEYQTEYDQMYVDNKVGDLPTKSE